MYQNPVLDIDFADPSVLKASDGYYYIYGTRSYAADTRINIQVARSRDLVQWHLLPDALPNKPKWASRTIDFWAPHVIHRQGTYYLYYSTQPDDEEGMGIGIATANRPSGPFVDSGRPLLTGPSFTTIDPMAFSDPQTGLPWLLWGSGHGPLWLQELDETHTKRKTGTQPQAILDISDLPYEKLIEGAFVVFHDQYYYLFFSGDNVWAPNEYAIMIARAKSITGPYEKPSEVVGVKDNVILRGNEQWDAPGQNSLIQDDAGTYWTFYHAVDVRQRLNPGTQDLRRVLLLDKVEFINGWPIIANGTPSTTPQASPVVQASPIFNSETKENPTFGHTVG